MWCSAPAAGFAASLDLSALNGSNGFRLDGIDAGDLSGRSVSGAGDVNGDGIADLVIGADGADPDGTTDAGESYVVFGSSAGFAASLDLAGLDGSNGFRLDGIAGNDASGFSVSGAGDVNGDGIADLIIGAPEPEDVPPVGLGFTGESYVVFGSSGGFAASLDLSALDGTNGFRLDGIDRTDQSGKSVSGAGDVNGDGVSDIIIGASLADPDGNSTWPGRAMWCSAPARASPPAWISPISTGPMDSVSTESNSTAGAASPSPVRGM